MKNLRIMGILAAALVFGIVITGCASLTYNMPITEDASSATLEKNVEQLGDKEVASYSIICGFIYIGRSTYQGLVVAEARKGKVIDVIRKNYGVYAKVTAYVRGAETGD